jgi:hypothetical protein
LTARSINGITHGVSQETGTGTPTFFINGRRFDGDWTDVRAFAAALDDAAKASSVAS